MTTAVTSLRLCVMALAVMVAPSATLAGVRRGAVALSVVALSACGAAMPGIGAQPVASGIDPPTAALADQPDLRHVRIVEGALRGGQGFR